MCNTMWKSVAFYIVLATIVNGQLNRPTSSQNNPFGIQNSKPYNTDSVNNDNLGQNLNAAGVGTPNRNYQYSYTSYGGTNNNLNFNTIDNIDPNSYCPQNWLAFRGNTCIRFVKSPKRSWNEAQKICKAYNGNLMNIDSMEKHAFVMKQLILKNERQNRFYISAKQTSLNNWENDNHTPFISASDTISYDDEDQGNFDYDEYDPNDPRFREESYNNPKWDDTYERKRQKSRLVYGFSTLRDKWMFIPTRPAQKHLFICESEELWDINNINLIAEDNREFDYGIEVVDVLKVPRGPFFIRQPVDTVFDTSRRSIRNYVTLKALAGGYPTPTYNWFKEEFINDTLTFTLIDPLNDRHFILSGGNLLIQSPDQTRHQGRYHCVASNKFGLIMSETVKLNFGFIMEFTMKRAAETGNMNWGKAIFCDPPTHYPAVKYYWSRNYFPNFVEEDRRVFVSYDGALYFSALEEVDRANYSCTVKTVSDTGRTGPLFPLRVNPHSNYQSLIIANSFPKVFPEAPIAGEDIRLECMAFGYPVPSYNWTRRDSPLPRNAYTLSYQRVLILPNATINDNGIYTCTITNDRKSISKNLTLSIQQMPTFTIPLHDKVKDNNGNVTFICESFAIPDVNYTWYKNSERLNIDTLNLDKYIMQDNILTIKYLDPRGDDGMYQCKAENQIRGVYSAAQLRVLSMKPSFKKHPLELEIYAVHNGNTTIECKPEAAPLPKFTWKKDGNVIGHGGHRKILPSGTLIIAPTSRDDEGIYTCVATNSYGADESSSRLIVLRELRFTQTLRARIITNVGEVLFLRCEVEYDDVLDVAFIWRHNGQRLGDVDEHILDVNTGRIIVDGNTLEIRNLSLLDTGDYECIATSAVNQIASKSAVVVQGPPGAPGGVKVIDVRKTTAVIEWIDGADNGRRIASYNILGRTNWNRTWVVVAENVEALEVDRYTFRKRSEIQNLTPWCGYEFSVAAINDLGVGIPSVPSPMFRTQYDVPYIAPHNLGGGGGKIGDLSITWDPLTPMEQHAPGISYKVFFRLHNTLTEFATEVINKSIGNAVVSVPIANYFTKYDVKVQASNEFGMGPVSDATVIYSAEDMPQIAPQQPVAMSFNSTALNVTWLPVEQSREIMRGKLIGHRLKYWKKDHQEEDAVYYLSRTTRSWALIVGLEPDTYYFVKVMVYNSAGEGPESERYLERTYRKAPQKPPSSVFVYGVDPSTVRVVWRYVSPTIDEEPVSGYKVRVWEADLDMATANDTYISLGSKLEAYINNLTPGKSYKLRVLAYSNGGDGRMSSPTFNFIMGITNSRNSAIPETRINKAVLAGLVMVWYLLFQQNH